MPPHCVPPRNPTVLRPHLVPSLLPTRPLLEPSLSLPDCGFPNSTPPTDTPVTETQTGLPPASLAPHRPPSHWGRVPSQSDCGTHCLPSSGKQQTGLGGRVGHVHGGIQLHRTPHFYRAGLVLPTLTQTPNTSERDTEPQGREITAAFPKVTGHSSQSRGSGVRGWAAPSASQEPGPPQ